MANHSRNFLEWIDRFGFRRPDAPEYSYAVQPVSLSEDASAYLPALMGAAFTGGGRAAADAVNRGGFVFTTRERPCTLHWTCSIGGGTNLDPVFQYRTGAAITLSNPQVATAYQAGEIATATAALTIGDALVSAWNMSDTDPQIQSKHEVAEDFYAHVPAATSLLFTSNRANHNFYVAVNWLEHPPPFDA